MADKKTIGKESWVEEHFGLSILILIVSIFIIWVLAGGPEHKSKSDLLSSPEASKYKY